MTQQEAIDLVQNVFKQISSAKSIEEIETTLEVRFIGKYGVKENKYPDINFTIEENEMGILEKYQSNNLIGQDSSPLEKFFYSVLWKNGDLTKTKHILDGLSNAQSLENSDDKDKALVFFQFGKFLNNPSKEPIIDQHIIRAFALFKNPEAKYKIESGKGKDKKFVELSEWNLIKDQLLSTSSKAKAKLGQKLIKDYKEWIENLPIVSSNNDKEQKRKILRSIDKLLFALGKTIKKKIICSK